MANRMKRFEGVLDLLPKGRVFDGELVVMALVVLYSTNCTPSPTPS
jgi:hypothetical protein